MYVRWECESPAAVRGQRGPWAPGEVRKMDAKAGKALVKSTKSAPSGRRFEAVEKADYDAWLEAKAAQAEAEASAAEEAETAAETEAATPADDDDDGGGES